MKRDMELVRKILLKIEDAPTFDGTMDIQLEGADVYTVNYHLELLVDAGYLTGRRLLQTDQPLWLGVSLTWEGHEFLDAAKDDTRWNQAKGIIIEKGGAFGMDIFKALLVSLARQQLGLP